MNRLREINDFFIREHKNLHKNKNRPRSLKGILEKTENLKELRNEYKRTLIKFEYRLDPKSWAEECEIYEALKLRFNACIKILETTEVLPNRNRPSLRTIAKTAIICRRLIRKKYSFKTIGRVVIICNHLKNKKCPSVEMANTPFDIKTATAIVQTYDGAHDGLNAFIDSANLLQELTKAEHLPLAIKFLRTRLTGKARLGLPNDLTTIDALVENVKGRCAEPVLPENLLAKLKATQQKGDPHKFCSDIDSLCSQLCASYLDSGVPDAVAKRMTTKAGVEALTAGISNNETKTILKAGNFDDIKQAIQKVVENTTPASSNMAQLLTFRNNRQPERKSYGSYRNRGGFRHPQYRDSRNQNPVYHNRDNRNYRNHPQNNYQPNPNFNNNNQRGRRQNNTRQVYNANAAEVHQTHAFDSRAPAEQNFHTHEHPPQGNNNNFLEDANQPWRTTQGRYMQ